MVDNQTLEQTLQAIEGVAHVEVKGDGYHYHLIIVSEHFEGLSLVKRQQWVYSKVDHYIRSGQLHALHMKTWTPLEWEKQRG